MKREWTWSITVSVKDTLLSSCFALLCHVCKEASSYKIPSTVLDWLDLSSSSCFPAKKTIKGHSCPVFRWTNGPRIIFSRKIFPSSASWPSSSTHDGAESQHLCFRGSGDCAWSTWGVDLVGTAEGLAPLTMLLDQCLWALHLAFSFRWGHLSNSFTRAAVHSFVARWKSTTRALSVAFWPLVVGPKQSVKHLICFNFQNHVLPSHVSTLAFCFNCTPWTCPVLAAPCSPFCTLTVRRSGLWNTDTFRELIQSGSFRPGLSAGVEGRAD